MQKEVYIIGIGPGNKDCLTTKVNNVISKAEVVFGAKRIIENIPCDEKYDYYLAKDILPIIGASNKYIFVVAFSGDTGFYSGANKFYKQLTEYISERNLHIKVIVCPGISSVSYFAAKLGVNYSEAYIGSLHGNNDWANVFAVVKNIKHNEQSFVLLSGKDDAFKLKEILLDSEQGMDESFQMIIGSRLSYQDEIVVDITQSLSGDTSMVDDLCILYVYNPTPIRKRLIPVLKDEEFIRGQVPMSKETIRHESIIALNLHEKDVVYDIGSGTGSVAIEIANLSNTLKVYAFEKKEEALDLLECNVSKFACQNIEIESGDAVQTVIGMPAPNAVFVGGSSGKLKDIIRNIDISNAPIRIVINAVTIETIAELQSIENDFEISDFELRQIIVSQSKHIGDYNLLQAQNPVMICSFDLYGVKGKKELFD